MASHADEGRTTLKARRGTAVAEYSKANGTWAVASSRSQATPSPAQRMDFLFAPSRTCVRVQSLPKESRAVRSARRRPKDVHHTKEVRTPLCPAAPCGRRIHSGKALGTQP